MTNAPLRFDPSFETLQPHEAETTDGLTQAMLAISRKTHADTGHAHRSVHAKCHGILNATLEVLPNLPPALAQGLYAHPATYQAILRFSTTPGDILDDNISTPRGAALKILAVPGPRLPGSETHTTQDYVLGNSPSFQVKDAKSFLSQLKPLSATTGRADTLKHALSTLSRTTEAALELVGRKSATLTTLAGQAKTHLLGDTFFTQAALLHGDYFGKTCLSPASPELQALTQRPLDLTNAPDGIRASVQEFFRTHPGVWDLRVQLATDLKSMPIEDAATIWPETDAPYVTVARLTAAPQDTWSPAKQAAIDDGLAFSPWTGLAAHRPLGSIMRARRQAYAASRAYRAEQNRLDIEEPA